MHLRFPLRLEADPFCGGVRRWLQQREQFLVEVHQRCIVLEQGFVDLSQALENSSIGSDLFTQTHKRSYHKDTHVNRSLAVENVGGHHSAVLGEHPGAKPRISVLLGTGHRL